MKRNYSLFRIAFVLAIGVALLLPCNGWAGTSCLAGSSGGAFSLNAGFWQSATPSAHGPAALTITPQGGNEWTGLFTIQDITYSVTGATDANGNLKFSSGRTGVKGTGKLQDLTRGGALLRGTYKLTSGDKGKIELLQNFTQPPDPEMPPDIDGSWLGTFDNVLCLMTGTVEWLVHQDRTPTGVPSTAFTGQETIETIIYDFVGTIDGEGNFVRIGVSELGFIIEGGKVESGELTANSVHESADGTNEVRAFRATICCR
jgi:hypothetical protein